MADFISSPLHSHIYRVDSTNSDYPEILKKIHSPPKTLYYRGNIELLKDCSAKLSLAVVGSRKISSYGRASVEKIITDLKNLPVIIISGLALGIDAAAHQTALSNNLPTIAVLGSPLGDTEIYPASHLNLAHEIINMGVLLLSEFPIGHPSYKSNFPQRNRIIAGLARGVIVAEAAAKSGALITSNFALQENRDVFAIPGSIFSESSEGVNNLIKQGAIPLTSAEDLFKYYPEVFKNHQTEIQQSLPELSEMEQDICRVIGSNPLSVDEIITQTKLPINLLNSALSSLEIKNILKNCGENIYIKI